jgi:hypothetical protein
MAASRYGYWLSIPGIVLGVAYLFLAAAILLFDTFPPSEPYQTAAAGVILLTAPVLILLWAALRETLPADRKVFATGSLALMIIFGTLTSLNRYVSLTVVPQALGQGRTEGLIWFEPYSWPSIMAAAEILAWGLYLGLALLCLAPAFAEGRLARAIFWSLILSGLLCLTAPLAQALDLPWLGMLGFLGWGPGLVLVVVLLAFWFRQHGRAKSGGQNHEP